MQNDRITEYGKRIRATGKKKTNTGVKKKKKDLFHNIEFFSLNSEIKVRILGFYWKGNTKKIIP